MELHPAPDLSPRGAGLWPVATLGLLVAAWVTFLLTRSYALALAEEYGPVPDVWDALMRDAYVGRHTLPYCSVVVLLDVLAVLTLAGRSRPGWPRILKVVAAVLLVPTVALHAIGWLVVGIMAG